MSDTPSLPGFKPKDLPDLTGTKAVVTGANSGIGFHTAAALADHGAEVVLACRNTDAGLEAAKKIKGSNTVEKLDLASQASIHEFVDRFEGSLDLLVNNAGVMTPPKYRETPEGHELQFGTNHLGHFALTGLLLPALLKSESPRVVTVASIAHHRGDESVLEGNPESSYDPRKSYGNTKLANLLFARELHRRSPGSQLTPHLHGRAPRRLGHQPGRILRRDGGQPDRPQDGAVLHAGDLPVVGCRCQPDAVGRGVRRAWVLRRAAVVDGEPRQAR